MPEPVATRAHAPRRPPRSVAIAVASALVVLLGLVGCSSDSVIAPPAEPSAAPGEPTAVYLAIGGVETLNVGRNDIQDNWPQIVFAKAFPAGAVYVNLATERATVESALDGQLPQAVQLHPTVVAVWVESDDVKRGTPVETYRDELTQLVHTLQSAGADTVLLLSPSEEQLDGGGALAGTIERVATDTGARFVDLGDTSGRGDDAGQRRIADAVTAALGTA